MENPPSLVSFGNRLTKAGDEEWAILDAAVSQNPSR
jgi:hypothetical protein